MTGARSLAGEIRVRCRERPDRPAIHFVSKAMGDRNVRWGELLESSEKAARTIRSAASSSTGSAPRPPESAAHQVPAAPTPAGSAPPAGVVVIVLDHSMELLYSLIGSILAGFTPTIFSLPSVKMNIPKYFESLPKLLSNAGANVLITDRRLYDQFCAWGIDMGGAAVVVDGELAQPLARGARAAPSAGALAGDGDRAATVLQYSSGTTGLRKGVALNDDAILHQIEIYAAAIRLADDDVIISWLPLYHDMGLIACCLMPLARGIPVVWISPFEWVIDPSIWFQYASKFRATLSWLPNFSYNYFVLKTTPSMMTGADLSSLRCLVNCSEPVRAESHKIFMEKFKTYGLRPDALGTCYALAENTFAVTEAGVSAPVMEEEIDAEEFFRKNIARAVSPGKTGYRMLSSGRPLSGHEVKIVDSQRRPLISRQVGEIAIRSRCLMNGYYKNPEATAASMDAEGWFYTGDLGYLTEERDLFVTGRSKDMIIVSGMNIYPSDIEYLVSHVPGVHPGRVVAFGVDNPGKGTEDLVVVVELERGAEGRVSASGAPSAGGSDAGREKEIEAAIRRQVSMCAECPVSDVRLVPPMWLLKSSSGKIARNANKEKYLEEKGKIL